MRLSEPTVGLAGVPQFIVDLGWWALFIFLFFVVLSRAQGTYWLGRLMRTRAHLVAAQPERYPHRSRMAAKLTGPRMARAQAFLDRWGFVGVPVSFLTIGFQTMVNAAAGYSRMRWPLYTAAMIPGCVIWAAWYGLIGVSLWQAWQRSPWLFAAAIAVVVVVAWALTRIAKSRSTA